MAEVDPIGQTSSRFRTTRFPSFIGGSTDPDTGNLIPAKQGGNPQSSISAGDDTGLGTDQPASGLDTVQVEDPLSAGNLLKAGGEVLAVGGATLVGSNIGEAFTGSGVAGTVPSTTVGDISASFGAGVDATGAQISGAFGDAAVELGFASAAPAAAPVAAGPVIDAGSLGTGEGFSAVLGGGSGAGGAVGGAESTFASRFSSGGNLGGAAGAGIGTFVVGLLTGQDPAQAAKSGLGAAAGFAIGNALLPGVGGFVGSFIGSAIGGRVICTELYRQGLIPADLFGYDMMHAAAHMDQDVINGYHAWATTVVKWMRRDDWLGKLTISIMRPTAIWRAKRVAYEMGYREENCIEGQVIRALGEPLCWLIGQFSPEANLFNLYKTA